MSMPGRAWATSFNLVPVRVRALFPPAQIEVDLFLQLPEQHAPQLYTTAGAPPSAADLDHLLHRGFSTIYMKASDVQVYREHLRQLASTTVDMPSEIRLEIAGEAVRDDFARAWRASDPTNFIAASAEFSQKVVDVCACESHITTVLASLAMHDGDTFAHICNVCTYAVMLSRKLGVCDDRELLAIGQAALLHDLGKRWIQQDILTKPGKLTREEREIISDHPRLGFIDLCHRADFSMEQLLMVYQHHEKLDGTGYPIKLVGDEICWTAQMCAVVDVFDALTALRKYRTPAGPQQALEVIEEGIGTQFSEEYVRCWTDIVSQAVPVRL